MSTVYLSWWLIAMVSTFLLANKRSDKFQSALNYLIAIIATLFLFIEGFDSIISISANFFWESMASYEKVIGLQIYPYFALYGLALVMPLFNYRIAYRHNSQFQYCLLAIVFSYVVYTIYLFGPDRIGYASFIIPGWQTTIISLIGIETLPILVLLVVATSWLIAKFRFSNSAN